MRYLRDPRVGWCIFAVCAVAYVIAHVAATFTESVNWDEYGLLWRADKAVRTGAIDGAGRPGLAVILLYGFVNGCASTESVLDAARLVWAAFTVGILTGVFMLVASARRDSAERWRAAILATACIALVPVFMRWSLQVRTDQPAVLASLWAGVALLATRRRNLWALVAGMLVGVGYLFSQKALYVAGLVAVVTLGDLWRRNAHCFGDLRRAGMFVVGGVVSLVVYAVVVRVAFQGARNPVSIDAAFDLFAWYREVLGFRVYRGMFSTLIPLVLLVGMAFLALARALRLRDAHARPTVVAIAVLGAGVLVGLFHAAAFPYFWITLGLFPAVAVGLAWPAVRAYFPRASLVVAGGALLLFAVRGIPYRMETLRDTRAIQRQTLEFADRLPASLRGFHPDGALVCRRDPAPFGMHIRETIARTFTGAHAERNTNALLGELRSRPVSFIVRTFRLEKFPPAVRAFWTEHYVPYHAWVELAGQAVRADEAGTRTMDVIAPGRYRWIASHGELEVGGRTLRANDTIDVLSDVVELRWEGVIDGIFVLDVDEPMRPASAPYHAPYPQLELGGLRQRW